MNDPIIWFSRNNCVSLLHSLDCIYVIYSTSLGLVWALNVIDVSEQMFKTHHYFIGFVRSLHSKGFCQVKTIQKIREKTR